jgi:hypothetical protein
MLVGRELTKLQKEFPDLIIEKIDILASPGKALQAGIKMIPTLQTGNDKLSGIFLGRDDIRNFVTDVMVGYGRGNMGGKR